MNITSDVQTLNNTITTNVHTLNDTITAKYDTLNTAKQDKGSYVAIDVSNAITLADNVTLCIITLTELKQLKNVSSSIQTQLDHKQESGDYIMTSMLNAAETELQGEIAGNATAITTAYTAEL